MKSHVGVGIQFVVWSGHETVAADAVMMRKDARPDLLIDQYFLATLVSSSR